MRRTMGQWFSNLLAALILVSFGGAAAHGASGIKVADDMILAMCTPCHANNDGIVSRISGKV